MEAAKMEARRPRQVQTDPGCAALQDRLASGSTLRAPNSDHGPVAGPVLAAPPVAHPSLLTPLANDSVTPDLGGG